MKETWSIKENYEFRRLYCKGASFATAYLVLYCVKSRNPHKRLGLTVSTKIGGAVQRNRCKRLLREAFRAEKDHLKGGYDYLLVARTKLLTAKTPSAQKALIRAARELKVYGEAMA